MSDIVGHAQGVFAQTLSCNGGLVIPVAVDMNMAVSGVLDFSSMIDQGFIDYIAGVYVDNLNGGNAIDLICSGTLMRVTIPANKQVFTQLLCVNPPKISWAAGGVQGRAINMYFANIPFMPLIIP